MCTIIGYHKLNKDATISDNFISQGFTLMKHRGPDAENYKLFNNTVCLGHQRLSIIDTSDRGNQPMETERSAIVFNGEVYNYIELKKELNKKNYYSNSDTEVLLTGFEEAGINFLNKCNGMFAFAFLNKFSSELFLVRDRFGVKPLHYLIQNGVLYFSSEIKPLISIKKDLQKNKNIYSSFLLNTATDYNEETFIKDIWQLPKGHYLTCKDGKIEIKQWYFGKDYDFDEKVFNNHRANYRFRGKFTYRRHKQETAFRRTYGNNIKRRTRFFNYLYADKGKAKR